MLLDDLKHQTRRHHTELEAGNGLPATRESYVAQLEAFYGFVAPWEEKLAATVGPDDPTRAGRGKTRWLEEDFAHFGYSSERIATLPRCADLPEAGSAAERLGACYVLEGSTLGGQHISRHLEQRLGFAQGHGYRYFRSYGAEVGAKWQAFRQELMRHASPDSDPVIIRAARETFEKLGAWFAARRPVAA